MNKEVISVAGPRVQLLPRAVIGLKSTGYSKPELEGLAAQTAQITTACCEKNIYVDSIVIASSTKDLEKRIKTLVNQKNLQFLVLYSARQFSETEKEYRSMVDLFDWYNLKMICYR